MLPRRHAPHASTTQVLLHFAGQRDLHALVFGIDLQRVVDGRQMALVELDVERRTDDLRHMSYIADGGFTFVLGDRGHDGFGRLLE